jgi:glycosyltransferase involved in cell wall biosynthesis
LINTLAQIELPSSSIGQALDEISKSISHATLQKITQRQLFIDVSAIVQNDMRTGIERVVRAQLLKLIDLLPDTVRVEPVYLSEENGLHYRYARIFTTDILNIPLQINEERVSVNNGDIFYGLDFYRDGVIKAAQKGIYTQWAAEGVSINFAVYDLLPLRYPHFFPKDTSKPHNKWLETIVPVSDTLICISNAVADELKTWISSQMPQELERNIHIAAVHLGSDIAASSPSKEMTKETEYILSKIGQSPTFLMVGTIEPRKGHLQTLAAFEILWEKGIDINLVIVGNEGWKGLPDSQRRTIPEIVQRLRNHPQSGKHLFWLEGISDTFLEKLYQTSTALIAASEDEGFGLPLIEAAHQGLPVIAREIPIFREVASDNAFYFSNSKEPLVLADAITLWLEAYQNDNHILSDAMSCITWKESAQKIIEVLSPTKEVNSEEEYDESKQMIETEKDQDRYRLPPRAEEIYLDLAKLRNKEEEK